MLKTPVSRLVPQMALPSIAAMLVTSAYHLADTFFVSKLGTYATGAVGVNSSIDHLILMAGSFLAVGSSSYTSRLLGANKDEQAARVLSTSFFFALFTGFLVFLLGNIFQVPLLRALGSSDAILPYSRQYARYVLLAAPFMAANFVLNHCLRAEGNSFYSMVGMVFG
ncbi:MAG TPA: MATE family efflux transporter, partial [Bacillota bacterium]|nr:MATE family efflux transporter [Bacillota bacterium]